MAVRLIIDEVDVLDVYKGIDIVSIGDDGDIEIFSDEEVHQYDSEEII